MQTLGEQTESRCSVYTEVSSKQCPEQRLAPEDHLPNGCVSSGHPSVDVEAVCPVEAVGILWAQEECVQRLFIRIGHGKRSTTAA